MNESNKNRRLRRVSSWMSDAEKSIQNEDEILAGKMIVLKILRYMEENHITQKELAQRLGVSPQYINKFLHGQDCDIKISTAIRYGKILNLKLIEIPDTNIQTAPKNTVIYTVNCSINTTSKGNFSYNRISNQPYRYN
ncbi:MAG: helix-turn-helix transcriptional regulator [Bacteroidales bacterium]|nr:helix-turn-helix transcriptional regulator [Bacteroidales bacterium]